MLILKKNVNITYYFKCYKADKYILVKKDIRKNYKDLTKKNLDFKYYIKDRLLEYNFQNKLFGHKLLLSLKKY